MQANAQLLLNEVKKHIQQMGAVFDEAASDETFQLGSRQPKKPEGYPRDPAGQPIVPDLTVADFALRVPHMLHGFACSSQLFDTAVEDVQDELGLKPAVQHWLYFLEDEHPCLHKAVKRDRAQFEAECLIVTTQLWRTFVVCPIVASSAPDTDGLYASNAICAALSMCPPISLAESCSYC